LLLEAVAVVALTVTVVVAAQVDCLQVVLQ
jgi:hypothetical protein